MGHEGAESQSEMGLSLLGSSPSLGRQMEMLILFSAQLLGGRFLGFALWNW